jgi:pimeloyl-ACP methyl ester carboxylesterase
VTENAAVAKPEPIFFSNDELKLAFYTWGTPVGVPVVLQHGFSADTIANWMLPGIVQDLVEAGRWVVGLDARGHGKSARVHDADRAGTTQMATDVRALIDVLAAEHGVSEVDYGGYSMGGFIGMHVITTEPKIRRAVIAAVGATAGGVRVTTNNGAAINLRGIADAMEQYADDPTTDIKTLPDRDARDFLRYARFTGADLRSLVAHMRGPQVPPSGLESITASVLVLAGTDDHLATTAEQLAALIPNARMHRTPGDHLSAITNTEFRATFTAFLCE